MAKVAHGIARHGWRFARQLIGALQSASRRHRARRKRVRELRELSAMNAIELRDIGISRLELDAAIRSKEKYLSRSH